MARKPFYVDWTKWKVNPRRGTDPMVQDVYELPAAIMKMDKRVKRHLCKVLASKKAAPLREAIRRSEAVYKVNRLMGWKLVFRGQYLGSWSHDLAWFSMAPSTEPKLVTVRTPFEHCCHVCIGGSGFKAPSISSGRHRPGAVLEKTRIPSGIREADFQAACEIMRLRSSGVLDQSMKEIARALKDLGRGIVSYVVSPLSIHYFNGKPMAISGSPVLSPAMTHLPTPKQKKVRQSMAKTYFKPCSWCKGSGIEY